MLVSSKEILNKAMRNGYAIPAFNINNMEIVQGIVLAAEKLNSPVILSTSEGALDYAGMEFLYTLVYTESKIAKVPLALHLDHGKDLKIIKKAIKLGYSSIMFDGSHLPFEKNVKVGSFYYVDPAFERALKREGLYSDKMMQDVCDNGGSVQGLEGFPKELQRRGEIDSLRRRLCSLFPTGKRCRPISERDGRAAETVWIGVSSGEDPENRIWATGTALGKSQGDKGQDL